MIDHLFDPPSLEHHHLGLLFFLPLLLSAPPPRRRLFHRVKVQLIGKSEYAQGGIEKIDTPAIHGVHIFVDSDIAIAGQDLFALFTDIIINVPVGRSEVSQVLRAGAAQDHPAVVMEILGARNVGMDQYEIPDRLGLRPTERMRARSPLNILRLPVEAVIAVHVVAADVVFIDLAVTVVVDPLLAEEGVFPFFSGFYGDHDTGVIGMRLVHAMGILPSHLGERAVPIEVFRAVFIGDPIAILIIWHQAGAGRIGVGSFVDIPIAAVGVHGRDDIEGSLIQQAGAQFRLAVVLEQIVSRVQGDLAALDLIAVDVAVDVVARLPLGRPCFGIGQDDGPDVPSGMGFADRLKCRQLRIGFFQCLEGLGQPGMIIKMVEGQVDLFRDEKARNDEPGQDNGPDEKPGCMDMGAHRVLL